MYKAFLAIVFIASAAPAWAQMSPEGLWRSLDDKTGEPSAEIRIADIGAGVLHGRIEKQLRAGADPLAVCSECSDERKGKPVLGLEIIRGAQKAGRKDVWENGKILDPENGRNYALRMTPIDGGKKLEVRGSIGPFGRTQTWLRVQ